MKKIVISIIVFFCLWTLVSFAETEEPVLAGKSAILMEASRGAVLYRHNATERVYPASTTKILTVLLAIEKAEAEAQAKGIDPLEEMNNTVLTVSYSAMDVPWDSSSMGLSPEERITLYQCMLGTMLVSGNEAANVLAEYVSGSIPAFVEHMNERAQAMGAKNSHFANANGYHDDNHYTTAEDMANIMREALRHDAFRTIIHTGSYMMPATNISEEHMLHNTNQLLFEGPYYYPDALGGKTGYTSSADFCLVAAANKDGLEMISAVFGAPQENGKTYSYVDTKTLFQYAYDQYGILTAVSKGDYIAELPVRFAKGRTKSVKLVADRDVFFIAPKSTVLTEALSKNLIFTQEKITAPVAKGTVYGTADIYCTIPGLYSENTKIGEIQLLSDMDYEFSIWAVCLMVIKIVLIAIISIGVLLLLLAWIRPRRRRRSRYSGNRPKTTTYKPRKRR